MAFFQKEKTVMASCYAISIFLLIKFVPKDKLRQATVSFLSKQFITWLFGTLVVEKGLIKYPYRPFYKKTYKASFDFEYFFYPVFSVLFNLYYPVKANKWMKILYYFINTSLLTVGEVLIHRYTKLIKYKRWKWYWSFITMWISNYVSHVFYKWFFKGDIKQL